MRAACDGSAGGIHRRVRRRAAGRAATPTMWDRVVRMWSTNLSSAGLPAASTAGVAARRSERDDQPDQVPAPPTARRPRPGGCRAAQMGATGYLDLGPAGSLAIADLMPVAVRLMEYAQVTSADSVLVLTERGSTRSRFRRSWRRRAARGASVHLLAVPAFSPVGGPQRPVAHRARGRRGIGRRHRMHLVGRGPLRPVVLHRIPRSAFGSPRCT